MKLMIQCFGGFWKCRFQDVRDLRRYLELGNISLSESIAWSSSPEEEVVVLNEGHR